MDLGSLKRVMTVHSCFRLPVIKNRSTCFCEYGNKGENLVFEILLYFEYFKIICDYLVKHSDIIF